MMYLRPAEPEEVFHVAKHMREHDYKEISCLRWTEGRDDLAADLTERYSNYPNCYVCGDGADRIAIIVYVPVRSGVWSIGMFATDNFQKVGGYLTKKIIREIIPMLMEGGAHRIECQSIEGYDAIHKWLGTLGLREESKLLGFGRDGEDFCQFTWVKKRDGDLRALTGHRNGERLCA